MRDADWYNQFFLFLRSKKLGVMRKSILSFVCICLVASLFAQTENVKGGNSKHKISAYHAIGVDNAFSPVPVEYNDHNYYNFGARLHVLNGIQFNPWVTLAFDLQLSYNHFNENYSYTGLPMKSQDFKGPLENVGVRIGLDIRYRILDKPKWSPILGGAFGPSLEAYTYPQREKKQPNDWWFGGYITTYFGMSYRFENGRHLWFGFGPSVEYIKYYTGFTNFKFEIQF